MMDTPNQLAMALEGRYRLIERLKSEDCRTIIKGQDVELDPGRSWDEAEMDCLDGDTLIPGIALAKALTGDASARHMLIRNECGWLVDPSEYFPSDGVLAAAWDEVVNEGGEND